MERLTVILAGLALAITSVAEARSPAGHHVVPGQFQDNRGPDGNSIFLDAPDGLILVDTGRHPEHSARLLAYARARNRPIVAIVNTHWHLDHTSGNGDIRAVFPRVEIHASHAVDGAIATLMPVTRTAMQRRLDAGEIPAERRAEVERYLAIAAEPQALRPTRPVTGSRDMTIGGRALRVNFAPFAATEGDVWLYDSAARLAIVGDLVTSEVPFLDTACPEGWRRALDAIAATPFTTLIPGHGDPMTRAQFLAWRTAFGNFVDCGGSDRPGAECVAGWFRDAASFIAADRRAFLDGYVRHYLDSRLRAAPEERRRHCRPLAPA